MNWEAIGAVGEIFGALAVVATLFYLTRQIHQSTKVARANLSKDLFLTSRSAIWDLATNPDLAKTFSDIRGFDDVELTRRTMFFQSFFRLYEVVFTLHNDGLVDDGIYESYVTMIRSMRSLGLSSTSSARSWERRRKSLEVSPEMSRNQKVPRTLHLTSRITEPLWPTLLWAF